MLIGIQNPAMGMLKQGCSEIEGTMGYRTHTHTPKETRHAQKSIPPTTILRLTQLEVLLGRADCTLPFQTG